MTDQEGFMKEPERLTEIAKKRQVPIEPEPLADFRDKELTLRRYDILDGNYGRYALLDCVDENGEAHLLSTGGVAILRILDAIDPEADLPTQVTFVKVKSGNGREIWSIQ